MAQRVGHVQKPIKPATSWRDVIKVHPAADLFPLMPEAELRELGEDIKKNGLTSPIVFFKEGTSYSLLDGRNRHADRDERRHHDANECVFADPRPRRSLYSAPARPRSGWKAFGMCRLIVSALDQRPSASSASLRLDLIDREWQPRQVAQALQVVHPTVARDPTAAASGAPIGASDARTR